MAAHTAAPRWWHGKAGTAATVDEMAHVPSAPLSLSLSLLAARLSGRHIAPSFRRASKITLFSKAKYERIAVDLHNLGISNVEYFNPKRFVFKLRHRSGVACRRELANGPALLAN